MTRRIVLFTALFFAALVAGGAFVIWIDYSPDRNVGDLLCRKDAERNPRIHYAVADDRDTKRVVHCCLGLSCAA